MTTRQPSASAAPRPAPESRPGDRGGWRASRPELAVGAIAVLATSLAAYAYGGAGLAVVTVTAWAVAAIAFMRTLVPTVPEPLIEQLSRGTHGRGSFLGFWRKRAILRDATTSLVRYDAELRPTLQHLLAARLAERHGVSLSADPATARRIVFTGPRDNTLWFWLDPARPAETDERQAGIPLRTLAAVLDRLERL